MSNVSGWLPNLIGPVEVQDDGTALPARPALNLIGFTIADNPVTDATDITSVAGAVPTGTGIPHIVSGVQNAAASLIVNADVHASAAIAASKVVQATGTGLVTVTSGALDAASSPIGAGFLTWAGTPSSANLASLMTDETGTGALVFGTAPLFKTEIQINNPANTFKYTLLPSNIAADRVLSLPLLVGSDTLVTQAHAQALTNKTIVASSNTITAIANTNIDAAAAIAGTKIAPDFGSQNVVTTGTGTFGATTVNALLAVKAAVEYQGTKLRIRSQAAEVSTTDATVTTLTSFAMADESLVAFDVVVTAARQTNVTKGGRWKRSVVYRRTSAGAPTIVGTLESGTDQETDAGWDVTIDVSSNDVRVRVTGAAATNINWTCELRAQETLAT